MAAQQEDRLAVFERRLAEAEDMARANRRELELQFRRMAEMQVQIDRLLRESRKP
jgi:hypothetical protein